MNSENIWKNIPHEENPIGHAPSIINEQKKPLTRNNLKMYATVTPVEDINKDTFLDYFDESTLDKAVPSTELYLPHLIFYDNYTDDQIIALTNFIFELISCHVLTEDTGMNYIQCMFNRPSPLHTDTIKELLEKGIEMGVNFDHLDNDWNSILDWALVGNGYPDIISDIFPYISPNFHPDIKDGGFYVTNRDDLMFKHLVKAALGKIYFNYKVTDCSRDNKIATFQKLYKQLKDRNNKSYLANVLINRVSNFYLIRHLDVVYDIDDICEYYDNLQIYARLFKEDGVFNTIGDYFKEKEKQKELVKK